MKESKSTQATSESERMKEEWYSNPEVKFQIKEWTKIPRDVTIKQDGKVPRRYCVILGSQNVDFIVKRMRLLKINASVYASMTHYDFIEPNREANQSWRAEREKHITGIDLYLDFDDENSDKSMRSWMNIVPEVEEFKRYLDYNNIKYTFWMSGIKGFQFVISYDDIPDSMKSLDFASLVEEYYRLAKLLKKDFPHIDTTIYSDDRIFKCPYTLTNKGIVVLPLRDENFLDLIQGRLLLTPSYILKNIQIRNRGFYFRGDSESTKSFIEFKLRT